MLGRISLLLLLLLPSQGLNTGPWQFPSFSLTSSPTDLVMTPGKTVMLPCTTHSSSQPDIRWKKDGLLLDLPSHGRRLFHNGSLLLESRGGDEAGLYQCVATMQGVGTLLSTSARVTTAGPPKFLVQPASLTVFQTQTAVFQCSTDQLRQQVLWYKKRSPLQLDHRMLVLPSGALEITNVNIGDRASYYCVVSGTSSVTADLKLQALPESAAPEAPSFLVTPFSQAVILGEEVTLECAANGVPQPSISWLKDGRELELDLLNSRFVRKGLGSLTIRSVEPSDEGGYQCRAENSEDSLDTGVELAVLVAPALTKSPVSHIAYEKDDILFECAVAGRPEPNVLWFKNGDLIIQSEYFQMVRGTSLKILGLVSSDAGIYQCISSNQAGSVQASAQLRVESKGNFSPSQRGDSNQG
jgi:neogenin